MTEPERQWRTPPGTETRLTLVEHNIEAHVQDCERRQGEIHKMFSEVQAGIKAMGERLNKLHVQWLTSALSLVGGGFVFLFGKVMKWW